jgi:hypothetical protein
MLTWTPLLVAVQHALCRGWSVIYRALFAPMTFSYCTSIIDSDLKGGRHVGTCARETTWGRLLHNFVATMMPCHLCIVEGRLILFLLFLTAIHWYAFLVSELEIFSQEISLND